MPANSRWDLIRSLKGYGRLDEPANEELLDTNSSNIIWEIKSKGKEYCRTWNVERGAKRNTYSFLVEQTGSQTTWKTQALDVTII